MQMNSKHNRISMAAVVLLASLFIVSCEKKFTDPPPMGEPDVVACPGCIPGFYILDADIGHHIWLTHWWRIGKFLFA